MKRLVGILAIMGLNVFGALFAQAYPDLRPEGLSGWAAPVLVGKSSTITSNASTFYDSDYLYVRWGAACYYQNIYTTFQTYLYVDGEHVHTWNSYGLNVGYVAYGTYELGYLSAGYHTIKVVTDAEYDVYESTESNNTYTKTIYVNGTKKPDLKPASMNGWSAPVLVGTSSSITSSASTIYDNNYLYVRWSVGGYDKNISSTFCTYLYIDGVKVDSWNTAGLNAGYFAYATYALGYLSAGTHTIKIVTDATGVVSESNESNNTYTKTITVLSSKKPDLKPAAMNGWSAAVLVGTSSSITSSASTIYDNNYLYVRWSVGGYDKNISSTFYTDLYIDGVKVDRWNTAGLNAGYFAYATYSLGYLSTGTHTIKIVTDATGVVSESNENNNTYTKTITVLSSKKPDLKPAAMNGWSAAVLVGTSSSITSSASTIYDNNYLYVRWSVGGYDKNISSTFYTDLYIDGVKVDRWNTAGLNAGYFAYATYALGYLSTGTHTIKIVTDATGVVSESNENNNTYTKTITVLSSTKPDLKPASMNGWNAPVLVGMSSSITSSASTIYDNNYLYVRWSVGCYDKNISSTFYTDLYIDGVKMDRWSTAGLNAGQLTHSAYALGYLKAGTHTIKIVTDATGVVSESNESNNTYTKTITVLSSTKPDLKPTSMNGWNAPVLVGMSSSITSSASTIKSSDYLYVRWSVGGYDKNISSTFYTDLYIDGVKMDRWSTAGLNAGQLAYATYALGYLKAGTHTIKIVTDATGVVSESNESNNTYTKTITVVPVTTTYGIQFVKNEGSGVVSTKKFTYGQRALLPTIASLKWTRAGYNFRGWATSAANARAGKIWKTDGAVVTTPVAAGKTLTVYAVWTLKSGYYEIKFNKNDGTGKWRTVAFKYGTPTALPSCVNGLGWTRAGYSFTGWATSLANASAGRIWKADRARVSTPVLPGKTLVVYAVWGYGNNNTIILGGAYEPLGSASVRTANSEPALFDTAVYDLAGQAYPATVKLYANGTAEAVVTTDAGEVVAYGKGSVSDGELALELDVDGVAFYR